MLEILVWKRTQSTNLNLAPVFRSLLGLHLVWQSFNFRPSGDNAALWNPGHDPGGLCLSILLSGLATHDDWI